MTKLTLKASLSPEKLKELNRLKNLKRDTQIKKDRDQKHNAIRGVFKWLYKTYPETFFRKGPKPLKIGIENDIFEQFTEDAEISKKKIRLALKIYTRTIEYQTAVLNSDQRIDLNGKPAGSIDQSHKDYAQEWIAHKKAQKIGQNKD